MKKNIKVRLLNFLLVAATLTTVGASSREDLSYWDAKYSDLEKKMATLESDFAALKREIDEVPYRHFDAPAACDGRLTTESGVPLSTSDRASQTTLYFTPYKGGVCATFGGTLWTMLAFTEISISLSGISADTNYDVFVYNNSGTLTLELSAAWASNTARTDAVSLQNGILVKTSATSRRLVGTIRGSAANNTEDSQTKRFVWNYLHRLPRTLRVVEATNTWTYNSTTWREANNTTNRVAYVVGENDQTVRASAMGLVTNASGTVTYASAGVGVDSTTVNSATMRGSGTDNNGTLQAWAHYQGFPGLGYHFLAWLESGNATAITFWGDNGNASYYQSGLVGVIYG